MYQNISIIGHLGQEPELRYLADGTSVTSFSVATSRKWGGDNPGEETTWFRISAWGRQAEACNQYLHKGSQVFVEGSLTPDKETGGPRIWTDSSGNARASYEVRAFNVKFLGGRSDTSGGVSGQTQGPSSGPSAPVNSVDADEIPF